jgi:hypothetical protein
MGNAYFGSRFGDLTTTTAGVTTTALSATQQSVGTGLGTAGIMVGEFLQLHELRSSVRRKTANPVQDA